MVPPSYADCPCAPRRARWAAFTLVEMLVVLGVISILLTLVLPAVTHLLGAGNLSTAAFAVSDTLEKARAYAMANSTYVWVGFAEQNAASNTASAPAGIGMVTVAAAASRDGTCVYNTASPTALDPSRIIFLDRAHRFDGVHLDTAQDAQTYNATLTPASNMYRTAVDPGCRRDRRPCLRIPDPPSPPPANGTSMTFSKVVEFSPQGVGPGGGWQWHQPPRGAQPRGGSSPTHARCHHRQKRQHRGGAGGWTHGRDARLPAMKMPFHPTRRACRADRDGFSMVEVTLALGIAGFCLVALLGLLPLGTSQSADASKATAGTGLAQRDPRRRARR